MTVSHPYPRLALLNASRHRTAYSAALVLCAAFGYSAHAAAQADVNPQPPNVLLLIDTSGSMEYKSATSTFPVCRYNATGLIPSPPTTSEKSRWTDLVEVLTGSITNYDCQTLDRGSAAFKSEYQIVGGTLGSNSPYDFLYANPYHRPMSGTCVSGPGTMGTNPAAFPATAFNYHVYNNTASSCVFSQAPDGILDAFQSGIRFGLMTFDTDPDPGQGELGTYSYVVGTSHQGKPTGCVTPSNMEVGARNASAPPWEGRLVPFGDPSPGSLDYQNKNQQIQQVLRASRPYGATPIAGMMSDARDFLWNDNSFDLVNTTQRFGPNQDPYASCRKTSIILMTDGQPNMDLRGNCSGTDCPFSLPEDIAANLLLGAGHQPVTTYVVGFALNTLTVGATTVDCTKLTSTDLNATPGALCAANPDNAALQACCNLARIAVAGDTAHPPDPKNPNAPLPQRAFFANDRNQLRSDISAILAKQFPTTSRTQAVFSPVAGTSSSTVAPAASYRFFSSFTPVQFESWSGEVSRERWTCDPSTHQASRVDPDPTKGDSFAANLNSQLGRARTFYTVQATDSGSGINSDRTIRLNLGGVDPDGVGAATGTFAGATASTFISSTSPASMALTSTSCVDTSTGVALPMTAQACRDRYLNWLVGADAGTVNSRCQKGTCNLLGDIFHATPRVVNAPSELTADESYQAFQATYVTRPLTLYTSSNDGFLHAFKVASNVAGDTELVDQMKSNELWALVPPAVLPHIPAEYPFTHQLLMDGVSVVKDVVARKTSGSYPYVFERTIADAQAGASVNVTWRTILVQSFGGTFPGYFAVDVTNPDPTMTINGETGGPRFLWQLTTDSAGNPLFGTGGATPIITTLLVDEDGTGAREVPVAVLPGGSGGAGSAGPGGTPGCVRATPSGTLAKFTSYPPRPRVPCYTTNLGARSLTIVRLDTGKILRTFRRSKTEVAASIQARVTESPIDSPITGEPVAFPSDVGAVADRIFVGDQDGTMWKVSLNNKSTDQWTMALFWDAYPAISINAQPVAGWSDGQPIATAPVVSVDTSNNVTLAFSTGDQAALGSSPGMLNYVWSLRDLPDANQVFFADLFWVEQLLNGERVTGPMSLFNSYLYFSTVTPPAANAACTSTNGASVWGMNYIVPRDGNGTSTVPAVRTVGGAPAPFLAAFNPTNPQFVKDTDLLGTSAQNQAVIFGVAVAQVPTCYATDTVPDAYLGSASQLSHINPGKTQLLIQTGSATLGTGGKADVSTTGSSAITLPASATPAHIDAWASIVE
jgi:type IV pilus assembly protein PilY1